MIDIVIADDHGLIRHGLRGIFSGATNFQIIGEACNGKEALDLITRLRPAVAIVDWYMPELSGIELLHQVKSSNLETAVLILSASTHAENVVASYMSGASGYLFKGSKETLIFSAVEKAAAGEVFYSQLVMNILIKAGFTTDPGALTNNLTQREKEILKALVKGKTNKEIAAELYLSTRTIDAHRRNIMTKLQVSNSAQLVRLALEKKLV